MPESSSLMLGEFRRTVDERHRITIPTELADALQADPSGCILAKQRPGALSLWPGNSWRQKLDAGMSLVQQKISAGRLEGRLEEVQTLGRLLSTRHTEVQLAARGRLLIPEGFRDFLAVEPGEEAFVVGAAVCVEIWRPGAWLDYQNEQMGQFRQVFDDLSG